MASIRIEDEARKDPRFVLLGKKLGTTKFDALARMTELWAYCTENQTYYMREEIIDVCAEFDGFAKLIVSDGIDLAERRDNGLIRIKGTKGRIEWLKKLRNQSKNGGDKTKAKWQAKRLAKARPEPGPKEGPPSLSPAPAPAPAPALSPVKEKEEKKILAPSDDDAHPKSSPTKGFIDAYCLAFKSRYHTYPVIDGQQAGIAKALTTGKGGLPLERAIELVRTYLEMNDAWFATKTHDLVTFKNHLSKIAIKHDTGNTISRKQVEQASLHEANVAVAQKYLKKVGEL